MNTIASHSCTNQPDALRSMTVGRLIMAVVVVVVGMITVPHVIADDTPVAPADKAQTAPEETRDTAAGEKLRKMTEDWDKILVATVNKEGKVDYTKIKTEHRDALQHYLEGMATVDVDRLNKAEQLAFFINLYNATVVQQVIRQDIKTFKPSDDDFKIFKADAVDAKLNPEKAVSLNDLEHKVIRPRFEDARVHAALVCAAVSCPPLINHAYMAENVDERLDENVQKWLTDGRRNIIDDDAEVLKLSQIFQWYADDFGGEKNVANWVGGKLKRDFNAYRIEYIPYDWSLNNLSDDK